MASTRKYSKLYDQMILYFTKVAIEVWGLTEDVATEVVYRYVNNLYSRAVKLIRLGKCTEDELIMTYPLN